MDEYRRNYLLKIYLFQRKENGSGNCIFNSYMGTSSLLFKLFQSCPGLPLARAPAIVGHRPTVRACRPGQRLLGENP